MVIRKGSIYWVNFSPGKGSEPIGRRPGLVIQNDILNDSKLNTVIMLAMTSTIKFGELPGNVILRKGEANLPKKCVINTTQIKSVDKKSIKEKIGTLSNRKMDEVHEGLKLILAIPSEEGLLGAVGMEPDLEEVAEKTMEGYQRRADDFGREVEI